LMPRQRNMRTAVAEEHRKQVSRPKSDTARARYGAIGRHAEEPVNESALPGCRRRLWKQICLHDHRLPLTSSARTQTQRTSMVKMMLSRDNIRQTQR